MHWFKHNWKFKLLAFALALFLWVVLYVTPPAPLRPGLPWGPVPAPASGR